MSVPMRCFSFTTKQKTRLENWLGICVARRPVLNGMIRLPIAFEADFSLRHAGTATASSNKKNGWESCWTEFVPNRTRECIPDASRRRRRIGRTAAFAVTGIHFVGWRIASLAGHTSVDRGQQDVFVVNNQMSRFCRCGMVVCVRRQWHGQFAPIDQRPAPFLMGVSRNQNKQQQVITFWSYALASRSDFKRNIFLLLSTIRLTRFPFPSTYPGNTQIAADAALVLSTTATDIELSRLKIKKKGGELKKEKKNLTLKTSTLLLPLHPLIKSTRALDHFTTHLPNSAVYTIGCEWMYKEKENNFGRNPKPRKKIRVYRTRSFVFSHR